MIPGAAPFVVPFEIRVACPCCDGPFCVVCDSTGILDALETSDREDVEPAQWIEHP